MTKKEIWSVFIKENPTLKNKSHDAWCFGGGDISANELAELVLKEIKTATSSAYELYEIDNSPLPPIGGLNIILDAQENAICITETTNVYVCAFNKISSEHAFKEGEGNRSVEYWRKVHKEFFTNELKRYDKSFDNDMLVVCEEFKVIYK